MHTTTEFDQLIRDIQAAFRDGRPDFELLGWDRTRLQEVVRQASRPMYAWNCTSFDYEYCNTFQIEVGSEHRNRHRIFTVKISFVAPYYCAYWARYPGRGPSGVVAQGASADADMELRIKAEVERCGFRELPGDWSMRKVPGVELELSDPVDVTIDKCLFCDHE